MRDEFGFDTIQSIEFCVSLKEGDEHVSYLVPADERVQEALGTMLFRTAQQFDNPDEGVLAAFEISEKYAPREPLIADLTDEAMAEIAALYADEGWPINAQALREPGRISYYFAVFRDERARKLVAVRQATQFKGIVKSHLIRLIDDSLTMVGDNVFKLDNEFDFLITQQSIYILHPIGFERIAEIEEFVSEKAQQKALDLGNQIRFADFRSIATFVAGHKRAARLVAALASRGGLNRIKRSKFIALAGTTAVRLENVGQKIRPAAGAEMAFLELLDDRRYTTAIRTGGPEAFVASSRRPVSP